MATRQPKQPYLNPDTNPRRATAGRAKRTQERAAAGLPPLPRGVLLPNAPPVVPKTTQPRSVRAAEHRIETSPNRPQPAPKAPAGRPAAPAKMGTRPPAPASRADKAAARSVVGKRGPH